MRGASSRQGVGDDTEQGATSDKILENKQPEQLTKSLEDRDISGLTDASIQLQTNRDPARVSPKVLMILDTPEIT